MKTLVVTIGLALMLAPAAPAFADRSGLAPADEYFGRSHLSVLGVRNAIKDLTSREDMHIDGDEAVVYGKLLIVEDAITDWRAKFPADTWLPRLGLSLARAWSKLEFADAAGRASAALDWIAREYPDSAAAPWAATYRNAPRALATADTAADVPAVPIEEQVSTP
jgi:hypothetical protein